MNINKTIYVHSETHQITNCMHDHHTEKSGGMSFQSEIHQQSVKKEPQTLEDALNELAAINREIDSKHKIFGTGNLLGNVISDINGEGEDTIVMLMPDNTTESRTSDNGQLLVSPDMLNALVAPRATSERSTPAVEHVKTIAVNGVSGFDTTAGGHRHKKNNRFIQSAATGIKKRITKWLHSLPEKLPGNDNKKEIKKKEMKVLNQEYILDSYDKTGQYHQIEKNGILNDNLNKRA